MLLDLLQYVRVLLLQGLLRLQVLFAVEFIVELNVIEGWHFPNLIIANVHLFSRPDSTPCG